MLQLRRELGADARFSKHEAEMVRGLPTLPTMRNGFADYRSGRSVEFLSRCEAPLPTHCRGCSLMVWTE